MSGKNTLKKKKKKYEELFKNFGLQLKYGVYNEFGAKKDLLSDLLLFCSSKEKKLVSLSEYTDRMGEGQKYIYYACGETVERIDRLPQTERIKDNGFEILYLTDDVDEFALKMLREFGGKEFRSVSDSDLGLENEQEKEETKKQNEDNKELLDFLRESLDGKVKEVRVSDRLKSHPVCLSSGGEITLEMEKVLNSMPGSEGQVKADRVLELNPSHPVFTTLQKLYAEDKDRVKAYAGLLYAQAVLIEGMSLEDPVAFSNAVCDLMSKE